MPFLLSPTTLNLYKECPRCFWLHFHGCKRPDAPFPSLPNGMDRILKEHFDGFRDRGILPPELRALEGIKLFENESLLKSWRNNLQGIRWKHPDGHTILGAVDNILQSGNKLIVLDYKTRGYPPRETTADYYQDQMDAYNFLLRKNGYETEDFAFLLFYHPDKVTGDGTISFHADLHKMRVFPENTAGRIAEALTVLSGDIPEINPDCEFCMWGRHSIQRKL